MPVNQEHDRGDNRGNGSIAKCSAAVGGGEQTWPLAKAVTEWS